MIPYVPSSSGHSVILRMYRRPAWLGEYCAGRGVLGPFDGLLPVCSIPCLAEPGCPAQGQAVAGQRGSAAAHFCELKLGH